MQKMLIAALCGLSLLAGCSRSSPDELWERAESARVAGDFEQAITLYRELVADHPRAQQAEAAAFMIASTYSNDVKDYDKAVAAFTDYLRLYPLGSQAPMALFLKAYLYHNALEKLDSAAAAYRAFIREYPEHEMVPSARFELDNLGRSPEELIPPAPEKKRL